MRYELHIRSRPTPEESVVAKHERIALRFLAASRMWLGEIGELPVAREPRSEPALHLSLTRKLSKLVKGSMAYANRNYLLDEGRFDDWFTLEFDPGKVDFDSLVMKAFPMYIDAFDAYFGHIANEEFAHLYMTDDYCECRTDIGRVYPVSFFDSKLCARALPVPPAAALARMGPDARIHNGGILLASREVLPFDRAKEISDGITESLFQRHVAN